MSGVRCRCASTVINAIDASGDQRADDLLADRFAFAEGGVLTHVAEIGREQDEALGASAPQRLGGERQRDQFVVRPVERGIDDGRRRRRSGRHPNFAVGKRMDGDLVKGNAQPRCEPGGVTRRRRQALNDDRAHGVVSPDTGCRCTDGVAGSCSCRGRGKIEFGLVIGVNSIERLALLDAIADLAEQFDAGTLVDRRAGGPRQAVQLQAVDLGNRAVIWRRRRRRSACRRRCGRPRGLAHR